MKKFYAICAALLAAASVNAQQLTFYIGGKAIEPNAKIYFNEMEKEAAGSSKVEVTMDPKLELGIDLYSSHINVKAECTSGQKIQMCAGGTCVSGTSVTKNDLKIQTNDKINLQFEYIGVLGVNDEIPTVVTNFEAWVTDEEADARKFTLVMNQQESSLMIIENNKAVEFTSAGLAYNVKGNATLSLFNALGQSAMKQNVHGNGVVSTSNLPRGLYFYTLRGNGVNQSGKIYIK